MSHTYKIRWLPRYSLKTFLLFYLLMGSGVAWIAGSYSEYLAEQRLLEALAERMPPGSMMRVNTNGDTSYLAGPVLM